MNATSGEWVSPEGVRYLTQRFEGLAALRELAPAWSSILDRQGDGAGVIDKLFNGPLWGLTYAENYTSPATVFGWTLSSEDGSSSAILPFRLEPSRGFGTLPRAIFVADGTHDSDYLDIPAVGIGARTLVAAALDLLGNEKRIQAVVLSNLPADSENLRALQSILTERGLPRREHSVLCYSVELPSSFDDYLKKLKPRVRSKVRQALRQAETANAAFHWCDDVKTLPRHLEGLFELHGLRWGMAGLPGCFVVPDRRRFYQSLASQLLTAGSLRFGRLDIAGEPVAYQIGALCARTYYQLQEGFQPSLSNIRVGTALRAHMIRNLIEEGVRKYDFMADGAQHKSEWGSQEHLCTTVAFALPRLRARVAYALRQYIDRRKSQPETPAPDAALTESES